MKIFSIFKRILSRQTKLLVPFKEWRSLLRSLTEKLIPLPGSSEKIFLSIGERLQNFTTGARALSEMSASAARLASGEEINTAIRGLREQLDNMTHYLNSSEKESTRSIEKLQHIYELVAGFDIICHDFKRIARSLHFLCISTQIESARLGQKETGSRNDAGFDILSEGVKRLANLIDAKATSILDNLESLTRLVQDAISRTQELLNLQLGAAVNMLRDAQSSFEALSSLNKKSSEISGRIAIQSSGIYKNIGAVVTSLQFHDITRQEIEHVGKALEQLREKIEVSGQDNECVSDDRQNELVSRIDDVCGTQTSQLQHTRNELADAVGCVINNLRQISKRVKNMVAETQALSGSTHKSGSSLLTEVESGIMTVVQSLRENVRRSREISASVNSAVNGIMEFVKEIAEIGAEIKLIALNAQIKASLAGEKGKTLAVIAEEIQCLAVDTRSNTTSALEKLDTITGGGRVSYVAASSAFDNSRTEDVSVADALEGMLASLHRVNTEFVALLGRIAGNGQTIGDEIEALSNQIVFHKEMGETLDGVAAELVEITTHTQKIAPSQSCYDNTGNIESTTTCDTKQKELTGNRHITSGTLFPIARDIDTSNNKGTEVIGDNVELF